MQSLHSMSRRAFPLPSTDDFMPSDIADLDCWHNAASMDYGYDRRDHDHNEPLLTHELDVFNQFHQPHADQFHREGSHESSEHLSPLTNLPSPRESPAELGTLETGHNASARHTFTESLDVTTSPLKRSYTVADISTNLHTPLRKHRYNSTDMGLVTPLSANSRAPVSWASKHDFMSPLATPLTTPLATPLATPMPLGEVDGVNPFYVPPQCMRPASAASFMRPRCDSSFGIAPRSVSASALNTISPVESSAGPSSGSAAAAAAAAAAVAAASVGSVSPIIDLPSRHASPFSEDECLDHMDPEIAEDFRGHHRCDSSLSNIEVNDLSTTNPEKPFGCVQCPKSFRRMEHLRRHLKIHTKERPFACDIVGCGRKFSRSDNLKAHLKTHAKRTGRNVYVEGLEQVIQTTKRRRTIS